MLDRHQARLNQLQGVEEARDRTGESDARAPIPWGTRDP